MIFISPFAAGVVADGAASLNAAAAPSCWAAGALAGGPAPGVAGAAGAVMIGAVGVFGAAGFSSTKTGSVGMSDFSFFATMFSAVELLTSHCDPTTNPAP